MAHFGPRRRDGAGGAALVRGGRCSEKAPMFKCTNSAFDTGNYPAKTSAQGPIAQWLEPSAHNVRLEEP